MEETPALEIFPDPDNPLEVKLEVFEGPLELLLHLIRRKKLAIAEVRLADLTASYLGYLRAMQAVDLDVAGEFLEIAATLILIKSRTLLPRPPAEDDGLEDEDPEEILRRRLLEYQRFKDAAFALGAKDWLGRDVFVRGLEDEIAEQTGADSEPPATKEPDIDEVSLFDLLNAFQQVMVRRPRILEHRVESEKYRIEDRIVELLHLLQFQKTLSFEKLFPLEASRAHWILTFMALLEMVKHRLVQVVQTDAFAPLHCLAHPDLEQTLPVWQQIATA